MWKSGVLVVLALLFSVVALQYFIAPYVWICLAGLLDCIYVALHGRNVVNRAIAVNVGVVFLVLGSFEGYLYTRSGDPRLDEIRNEDGERVKRDEKHDILGWAPVKNQAVSWRRYFGNSLLFDVRFTIDKSGLRISPRGPGRQPEECVLFFGGSFTFGAGMNDKETMPYLAASRHLDKYRAYNFAYSGYGAHHMLAALQHQIVDNIIDCQPRYTIYLGIADHIRRSANKASWAQSGPEFILAENGAATYRGQFRRDRDSVPEMIKARLRRSFIMQLLIERFLVTDADIALFTAIVDSSRRLVERRYDGNEFHVLVWDDNSRLSEELVAGLKEKGIRVHLISEILPGFSDMPQQYVLSEQDGHPSREAHRFIATYVSEQIIRE